MTIGTQLSSGGQTEYTIHIRGGCTFLFGAIPIDHFTALTKTAGKKAIVATQLAQLAGASAAWGLPADVDALTAHMRAETLRANPQLTPLGRWLKVGERDESSNAIVAHLRQVSGVSNQRAYPRDPDDLQRCIKLLLDVPDLQGDFHRMAEVSPVWASLVSKWQDITAMFHTEAGTGWRTAAYSAPQTYALMRSAIEEGVKS